jgi:hypothetical protein
MPVARAGAKVLDAMVSSTFQFGAVAMLKKLSDEYHHLCLNEMEAEEDALRATTAIRVAWHIDGGAAKGAPSQDALDAEADLWQRVAELRKKRHDWVAKHSKRSAPLRPDRNAGNARSAVLHVGR